MGTTQNPDGKKRLRFFTPSALEWEGFDARLVIAHDVSDRVRAELALHRQAHALEASTGVDAGRRQRVHFRDAALQAANVTGERGTLNAQAKSAARSAFESAKQRFFSHLITSMKTPTLIGAIERDLLAGHAAVIQIVSTGEALMERRLADIPTEDWGDFQVDLTPREYVLDYLAHSFPTQLFEPFTDSEGNLSSRPVYRDGQPVQCRDAVERRDRLIERLAALAPVQGPPDQIVQRFGPARVADIGCGVGFSTLLMAKAFPQAEFVGYDFHAPSIDDARKHATEHGLETRVRFEVAKDGPKFRVAVRGGEKIDG